MGGYGPNYRYLKHVRPGYARPFKALVPDKDGLIRDLLIETNWNNFQLTDIVTNILGNGGTGGSKDVTCFWLPSTNNNLTSLYLHTDLHVDGKLVIINDCYGVLNSTNFVTVISADGDDFQNSANNLKMNAAHECVGIVYDETQASWNVVWTTDGTPS